MMMNNKTIISLSFFFFFLWVIPHVHTWLGFGKFQHQVLGVIQENVGNNSREFMNMKKLGLVSKVCKMFFQVSNFSETSKKFSNNS